MIKFHSFADRLTKAIKAGGWKKKDFAKAIGVTPYSVSRYLHGGAPPSREVVIRMATVLLVTTDWLLTGKGGTHSFTIAEGAIAGIPLYRAKFPAGAMGSVLDQEVAEEYFSLAGKSKPRFAVPVRGRSMEPDFRDGDLIIVERTSQARDGDFVLAKCDEDEEGTFKKLVKKRDGYVLQPLNRENYSEIPISQKHRIIGKVVWLVRKV